MSHAKNTFVDYDERNKIFTPMDGNNSSLRVSYIQNHGSSSNCMNNEHKWEQYILNEFELEDEYPLGLDAQQGAIEDVLAKEP